MKRTEKQWITRGFESFQRGTFGNAGRNLFVSRSGVLQRIHHLDLNRDGYLDLMFCNSQVHQEKPPAYIYGNVLTRPELTELPSAGSSTGAVADLSGDGYDDLLLGMEKSGEAGLRNAFIYFGGPDGLSEKRHTRIPGNKCTSAAIGDFNGDGKPDIALLTNGKVRIFLQTAIGIEAKLFVEYDIPAVQIGAGDYDDDGFADLYVYPEEGPPRIYWGDRSGISSDHFSELPVPPGEKLLALKEDGELSEEERVSATAPIAKDLRLGGICHLFLPTDKRTCLVPVGKDRTFGPIVSFDCRSALSAAAGDINGDGHTDLVFAAQDRFQSKECSWIYWGGPSGFSEERKTALPTRRACDTAAGDLDGSGCDDIVICQKQSDENFSFHSLVFPGGQDGIGEPIELATHGARRVFIARTSDSPGPQVIFVNQLGRRADQKVDSHIFYGGPDGFSAERMAKLECRGATSAVACDINDDGWPDLIVINSCENAIHLDPGSFVFFGGPDGFRYKPDMVIPTKYGWSVSVADINRDGYLDAVVALFHKPTILIFYGKEGGFDLENPVQFDLIEGSPSIIPPRRSTLADFNGDGWLDLAIGRVGNERTVILWGGPDGFKEDRKLVLPTSWHAGYPLARDLTGNGYPDLILGGGKANIGVPHDSFIHIFWNGPEGMSPYRQTQLPANASNGIALADFNGDGNLDLFCCNYKTVIERDIDSHIYWGQPDGSFLERDRTPIRTHSASGCIAADFDEDGDIDLAVANHKTFGDHVGDSFVFWNGPEGFSEKRITRLPGMGPHAMVHAETANIIDGSAQEYYISEAFQLPEGSSVRSIDWDAELPPKTWVRAQLRFAADREVLLKMGVGSPADRGSTDRDPIWIGPEGPDTWYEAGQTVKLDRFAGPWVQYRLALGSKGGGCSPRVSEVSLVYG